MADKKSSGMGWVVALAGLGINLALGVLYTWSVVTATLTKAFKLGADGLPEKAAEAGKFVTTTKLPDGTIKLGSAGLKAAVLADHAFNWTALDALIPYAIALLAFGIMMAFAGRIQDRFGPRIVASVGGVFVGAGMILSSFNNMASKADHTLIILGFGLLTGTGIALAYACATPAAVKWFHPSKKGLITGIVVGGFGLASVYTAPLTTKLIEAYGVSGMFRILGIAFFVSIIACAQLLQNPPAGYVAPEPAGFKAKAKTAVAAPANLKCDYTWREMVKTPQFWLLWFMYACVAFAGLMMVGIISKVAVDLFGTPGKATFQEVFLAPSLFGLNRAYWFTVALAIGNGIGRPIAGIVSDAIGRTRTMVIVFLAQAILVGWAVGATTSMNALLLVGAGIGFMYGANLTLFPATTYDFFGLKNAGVNYGIVFTAWGIGGSIGNYIAGFAKTFWGGFGPAYTIAAVLCVIAAGLTVVTKAPRAEVCATVPASEVGEPA
ncbi:MAG TPA: OFA family MFS transporter [Coriobacteriia bacterium]|jgi:OFA family oxalate/formate antiporter-like MFS transporter